MKTWNVTQKERLHILIEGFCAELKLILEIIKHLGVVYMEKNHPGKVRASVNRDLTL